MEQQKRFGWMMAASLFILLSFPLKAQLGQPADRSYAVQVTGLNSELRDNLERELKGRTDLRLVYACVPAGVLVFEARNSESKQEARLRAQPLLEHKALLTRARELPGGQTEAEAACLQARNQ